MTDTLAAPTFLRTADLTVNYRMVDHLENLGTDRGHIERWRCELEWCGPNGRTGVIAEADILKVHADRMQNPTDALKRLGAVADAVADYVFRDPAGLEDFLGGEHELPNAFLVVQDVSTNSDNEFTDTGADIGRVLVARCLERLGGDTTFAVVNPAWGANITFTTPEDYRTYRAAVARWGRLGFESYAPDLLVADLLNMDVHDHIAAATGN